MPAEVRLFGKPFRIPDYASFLSGYKEIFVQRIYEFQALGHPPRVLDLGANVGLSVLFFKKNYPDAHITAFEADPRIFAYLLHNVSAHGLDDVRLLNQAAWNEDTTLTFYSEGADGGSLYAEGVGSKVEVSAIDIGSHLATHAYDYLKMDIEGAEELVLESCAPYLCKFKYVFVEYHSRVGHPQCLPRLLEILKLSGFRFNIQTVMSSPKPFVNIQEVSGFDSQLNIFAYKPVSK